MQENDLFIKFIYDHMSFSGTEISYFLKNTIKDFKPTEMWGYGAFSDKSYRIIEKEDFRFRAFFDFPAGLLALIECQPLAALRQ